MKDIKKIDFHIPELDSMKKYPQELFYIGNLDLLNKKKIGVVGSRSPGSYASGYTQKIIQGLVQYDNIIVSGGAIGIDSIAHKAATPKNTIMVSGTGLDIRYPTINQTLIREIEKDGLVLSQFMENTPSYPRNFAIRNELIVALSDILIVSYADLKSGTMRSVEYALKMKKNIYVLPHRIGESIGTNMLIEENKVKVIYDIDNFIEKFAGKYKTKETNLLPKDLFLEYCSSNPRYEDMFIKFGEQVFEYELLGKIIIENGRVKSL